MSDLTSTATDESSSTSEYVLAVAPEALEHVLGIRDTEEDPGAIGLRVEIKGVKGTDYDYDLGWATIAELDAEDDLSVQGGLSVVVAANSIENMRGAVLDLPRSAGQGGFVIKNPNRPAPVNPLDGRDIVLEGLNGGETIVSDGALLLIDGSRVDIRKESVEKKGAI
jgi:Fe-S cluster assembly iron-binding protein IscA